MLVNASLITDWFHVVGRVTDAMNAARKAEAKVNDLPKGARWATLKGGERDHTDNQEQAPAQLQAMGTATAEAYAIANAYASGAYSMHGIARLFGLHYPR